MNKRLIIINYDMEIGGVERSLISMLSNFNYSDIQVDLHLHSHTGPLIGLLPNEINILTENASCKTYRQSIKDVYYSGFMQLSLKRLYAKFVAKFYQIANTSKDASYYQAQKIWDVCIHNTEQITENYDVAISYLWPHHFTAFNVSARIKIAWIHTDYSTINIDVIADLDVWNKFDYIISISDACTDAFLKTHPSLESKIVLVENVTSPDFVRKMAEEPIKCTFSKQHFNIVSVGRLCEPKAFDRAVEVLNVVHQKGFTNIKWYIVGDGGDKSKIEALIDCYDLQNSFILLGSTTNPYPYIKAADLYIQPSRYEGKAVTITEAHILAKPVLITNYATSASQITDNVDGFICEQDIESIAYAVIKLYQNENLRNKLKFYCKEQNYSNSEELDKLYRLFN